MWWRGERRERTVSFSRQPVETRPPFLVSINDINLRFFLETFLHSSNKRIFLFLFPFYIKYIIYIPQREYILPPSPFLTLSLFLFLCSTRVKTFLFFFLLLFFVLFDYRLDCLDLKRSRRVFGPGG